jgi:hypothetical protein
MKNLNIKLAGLTLLLGSVIFVGCNKDDDAFSDDPSAGSGNAIVSNHGDSIFVGKGDVQSAFGWNNSQLQSNAEALSFSYESIDVYAAVCSFVTGEGTLGEQEHNVSIPRITRIDASIYYDARKRNQVNGFWLLCRRGVQAGTIPEVDDACVANEDGVARNGKWSAVTLSSSSGDGLVATHNGVSRSIPTPGVNLGLLSEDCASNK